MKKLIFIGLLILQNLTSFAQETTIENDLTIDEFMNAFYQVQNNPEKLIPFFDRYYYESFYLYIRLMSISRNACYHKPVKNSFAKVPSIELINELI